MKKNLLTLSIAFISLFGFSQEENSTNYETTPGCENEINTALTYINGSEGTLKDVPRGKEILVNLIQNGCSEAIQKLYKVYKEEADVNDEDIAEDDNTEIIIAGELTQNISPENTLENTSPALEVEISPCQNEAYMGLMLLTGNEVVVKNIPEGIALLTQLADEEDCAEAQLRLGLVYKDNTYVSADEAKAFEYIEKAANQNLPRAIAELGLLHQLSIGCTLNYEEALSLFEEAYELGDGMGAYCIGYCHFKGLGTVEQSYEDAIEWFTLSDYPMAKHWLGIFNYFGYGMPVDKEKAYELLLENTGIENSVVLLAHLEESKEEANGILSDYRDMDVEEETAQINTLLETEETSYEINTEKTTDELQGLWSGKLVEIEWSGERILRDFPASINISSDENAGLINYEASINENSHNDTAIILDESIYFEDFNISLPRLYKDDLNLSELDYKMLNVDFQLKTLNNIRFLVGYVETKISNWNEPGPPMLLVLSNDVVFTENRGEISVEVLEALLDQQGDNFINLYPNPFENDLLIQYDLVEDSQTSVEIFSIDGNFSKTIAQNSLQEAGKKIFQFNGRDLNNGIYVVRVTAEGIVHTKLIIKE